MQAIKKLEGSTYRLFCESLEGLERPQKLLLPN